MSTYDYPDLRREASRGEVCVARATLLDLIAHHDHLHRQLDKAEARWRRSVATRKAAKKRAQQREGGAR